MKTGSGRPAFLALLLLAAAPPPSEARAPTAARVAEANRGIVAASSNTSRGSSGSSPATMALLGSYWTPKWVVSEMAFTISRNTSCFCANSGYFQKPSL